MWTRSYTIQMKKFINIKWSYDHRNATAHERNQNIFMFGFIHAKRLGFVNDELSEYGYSFVIVTEKYTQTAEY